MTTTTEIAQRGFDAGCGVQVANPHLYSSDNWLAFELGRWFAAEGKARPQFVRKSRGHTIRADGQLFSWHDADDGTAFLKAA